MPEWRIQPRPTDLVFRRSDVAPRHRKLWDSLVGWWPMHNATGGALVRDYSQFRNDGLADADLDWVTSEIGTVADFSGDTAENAGIQVGDKSSLEFPDSFLTIWALVFPRGESGGDSSGRIIDKGGATSAGLGWSLLIQNNAGVDSVEWWVNDNSAGRLGGFGISDITLSQWQTFTVVQNGTDDARLYINGELVDSGGQNTMPTSTTEVYIGLRDTLEREYNGQIADIRCWRRPVSEAEISLLQEDTWGMVRRQRRNHVFVRRAFNIT